MTIEEKVKEAENLIVKANKLLEEVKEENTANNNILNEYWKDIETKETYYLNSFNNICKCNASDCVNVDRDDFTNYPSMNYAVQAQELKEFNDKLLAFKWCYDRDYEPKFNGLCKNHGYYVYYNTTEDKYTYLWTKVIKYNLIYFSSERIAKKCCDWLNSMKEENENG